jgi:hypothetical protein
MCAPVVIKNESLPDQGNIKLTPKKFIRRSDLSPVTRLHIACAALTAMVTGAWGTVTALSKQFMISRTFVYMLAATLKETGEAAFGYDSCEPSVTGQRAVFSRILSLRLEGRCSVEAVSAIMKRFGTGSASVGFISQTLKYFGSLLPDTLKTDNGEIRLLVYLSDEIFSKRMPILVTADPVSSAILKIGLSGTRKAEDWKNHWECLENKGYMAVYLVSDEGRGLCKAQKESLSGIFRQPDTYHAVAHRLGRWVGILENAAYKAIEKEDERWRKLDSARSDAVISRRIREYEEAKRIADEKIGLYDNFSYLYLAVINELRLFDNNGSLRKREEAEANIEEGLNLLESLGKPDIAKAAGKVRRTLPDLLGYFDAAVLIVSELGGLPVSQEAVRAICLAWQWEKEMIKAKTPGARKHCKMNGEFCLGIAADCLQSDYEYVREHVCKELDRIVRSSSLVECINSIIRPYLNSSKNHINQETLNLIMFYHNHRRYRAGKRKGSTPYELLTGRKQEKDWIELLFDTAERKDPSFAVTVNS